MKVFLSRSSEDGADALWIADCLIACGHVVVSQDHDMAAGSAAFLSIINEAIETSDKLLVVLSENWSGSRWCLGEFEAFFNRHGGPGRADGRIVVVRPRRCPSPGMLARIAVCDIEGKDPETARRKILDAVSGVTRSAQQSGAPSFAQPGAIGLNNLPPFDSHLFTGRGDELSALHEALSAGDAAAVTAVKGMAGVGKSTLARAYAEQFGAAYEGMWWVRAEREDDIVADLAALGDALDPGLRALDPVQRAREALRRIGAAQTAQPWLVVFDNLQDPALLRAWRPPGRTRTIATTRFQALGPGIRQIETGLLSDGESVSLLMTASARAHDQDGAARLARALGGLPLALRHAGACLRERPNLKFDQYAQRLEDLIARMPRDADCPATVAATIDEALNAARAEASDVDLTIGLMCFTAPDAIPHELIDVAAQNLRDADSAAFQDDLALGDALDALWRYSLINRDAANADSLSYSLHRLVQLRTRSVMAPAQRATLLPALIQALKNSFPNQKFERLQTRSQLLPHALSAIEACDDSEGGDSLPSLLNRLGNHFTHEIGVTPNHAFAAQLIRRALSIDEANLGPDHLDIAVDCANLAQAIEAEGGFEEAEQLNRRALAICVAHFGEGNLVESIVSNNLAELLRRQQRLEEARPLMERSVEIWMRKQPDDHAGLADKLNNLARHEQAIGNYAQAEALLARAIELDIKTFGLEHEAVARDFGINADLFIEIDRLDDAGSCMRAQHGVLSRRFGADSYAAIEAEFGLASLAGIRKEPGALAALESAYERLAPFHLGSRRPPYQSFTLARALVDDRHFDRADAHLRDLDDHLSALFGQLHPNYVVVLPIMARAQMGAGNLEEAERLARAALAVNEPWFGDQHRLVAEDLLGLAEVLKAKGDLAGALECAGRAEQIFLSWFFEGHRRVLAARALAASCAEPNAVDVP